VEITDAMKNKTVIVLDGHGNPDMVTLPQTAQNPQPISYDFDFNSYGQLEKVTDPLGSVTRYTYYPEASPSGTGIPTVTGRITDSNTGGYLHRVIIDQGNDNISQTFTYDEVGNITTMTDGEDVTTSYGYTDSNGIKNPFGEVLTLTQGASSANDGQPAVNLVTTLSYDENGNVIGSQSRGVTTTNTYDRLNRLRCVLNQGGAAESQISQQYEYIYDNNSNLRFIVYPKGNKDEFTYNNRDLLESKILGNGLTTESYTYWPNGNIFKYTDGESKEYQYIHDSHGRLKDIIDPYGNKVTNGYDDNSNVTSIKGIGIDGKTIDQGFDYDALNRMTHNKLLKDGNGGEIITSYDYKLSQRQLSVTTPNQHKWDIKVRGSGLTDLITDPLGNTDTNQHDQRGWLKHVIETESGGRSLTRNFIDTVLGAPNLRGDSMSRDYKHTYHSTNQLLDTVKDPENGEVSHKYDGLNRLQKEIRHIKYGELTEDGETTYQYNENGNLWKIIDSEGNITRYEYDAKDRLTDIFYPGTSNEHITYNGRDQVLTYTDLNGTLVVNTYDDAGSLTDRTITPAVGIEGPTSEHFEYDGLNRLNLASNSDSEVTFVYNKAGRLEREIQKIKESEAGTETIVATYEVVYEHDDNGNKTGVTYPSGKSITITPDALDRIDHIKEDDKLLVDYTYEGKGKIVGKNLQDVVFMESKFDDGRRPESLSYKSKSNNEYIPFLSRGMEWTLTDLKKHDIANGKKEEYTYDSAYRLRKVNDAKNNTSYEYDINEVEDIKQVTTTKDGIPEIKGTDCNERHQLVQYNGMDLTYDQNGNLTHFTHDYVYNWKNQLVKVITGSGVNVEYKYDALGRRIVKIVKEPNTSPTVTRYVHDGYQVIEERDINDQVQYRYTYGNGIDERIQIEKPYEDENNNLKWKSILPIHDSIGNVTTLTDDTGKVIEEYNYSPYGEVTYRNTVGAPSIDNIRIENEKIRIRFDRQVDLDKITIHLYIKVTQEVIAGTSTIGSKAKEVWHTPSILPENNMLTLKIQERSGVLEPGDPIEIFSRDFEFKGGVIEDVYDSGPPRVDEIISAKDEFTIVFSEDVKPDSVTDSVVLKNGAINVTGTIEKVGENEYKFIPDTSLSEKVLYWLGVSGVQDLYGKTMTGFNQTFSYTESSSLIFKYTVLTEDDESVVGNTSLLHGRTYEPEVGLYYYRNRYYHPQLGRFLQQDPMGYQDSMNLYQAFGMNPVNFVDPYGLQEKEFYSMYIANPDDLDRIQYLQSQARKGYAKGGAAAALTFIMSPLSAPTIIALCGSGLIYHGLEEYSDRRMSGQSELESRTGAVVDTLTLRTYPIFAGRDAGTGDIVSGEQKLKIVSDLIPTAIGGAAGIVSGSLFSRLNPSTSQLIDDAFRVLDFQRTSTGYVAVTDSTTSNLPILHRDQIIINNYQRYYNEAWINVIKRFNAEEISIPSGLNWKTYLGQIADKYARNRLKSFLKREGIAEGPGMDVLVNRWLRDPMGSGKYRIPDVKLEQTGIILDGTIGNKTVNTPQIQDFIKFSIGNKVIIIRPKVK
jgi:RHS repeat-associated protein